MKVIVRCRATLYERDGAFQVYVNDMFPDGIGSAQLAFEQLKAKLEQEGLFAPEHKKPLPAYPKCIGIVTSKTGAALQDIHNIISRRWPAVRLLLCPVNVQGFEAAKEIAAAIDRLDKSGEVDTIIVAVAAAVGKTSGSSTRRSLPGQLTAAKRPSSVPSDTRLISRFWTLLQISVRLPPRQQQSWLYQTGRNWHANYTTWNKIFRI